MPDFMLCNSKLTFQLTMTPEKTNFMTQGADGQKRLKQGPDLASYRGLSVIHSRAFSLETGQEPRDILRRRVRTAEYYRIAPHKDNHRREFELYNEARDTWFALTFQDLEAFSEHGKEDEIFTIDEDRGVGPVMMLGALAQAGIELAVNKAGNQGVQLEHPLRHLFSMPLRADSLFSTKTRQGKQVDWILSPFSSVLGLAMTPPKHLRVFDTVTQVLCDTFGLDPKQASQCIVPARLDAWTNYMNSPPNSQTSLLQKKLVYPFSPGGRVVEPGSSMWWVALTFYLEVLRRHGVSMDIVDFDVDEFHTLLGDESDSNIHRTFLSYLMSLPKKKTFASNVSDFYLSARATHSVNHELGFFSSSFEDLDGELLHCGECLAGLLARSLIVTSELLVRIATPQPSGSLSAREIIIQTGWSDLDNGTQDMFQKMIDEAANIILSTSRLELTLKFQNSIRDILDAVFAGKLPQDGRTHTDICGQLVLAGYSSFPMSIDTRSHLFHESFADFNSRQKRDLNKLLQQDGSLVTSCGLVNYLFLEKLASIQDGKTGHPFMVILQPLLDLVPDGVTKMNDIVKPVGGPDYPTQWDVFRRIILERIFDDPVSARATMLRNVKMYDRNKNEIPNCDDGCKALLFLQYNHVSFMDNAVIGKGASSMTDGSISLDYNMLLSSDDVDPSHVGPARGSAALAPDEKRAATTEFVIVRPNIEHNMLGIILGLGGSELGHTFWGQTELSCYDDSMHGIWGMSYKYHERAIVFNEKNLVRLWDIAYDGYNGGKDDSHVDWRNGDAKNSWRRFGETTMDLGSSYRGPSMMVMRFIHSERKRRDPGMGFQRNWPSPIVFHEAPQDPEMGDAGGGLTVDQENLHVVDVGDFKVFDKPLYADQYRNYYELMPHFHENHRTRKAAGEASAESETQTTCLAFQGSMRVKQDGKLIQEIQGSGHHGPDYVGVASVRAGKGIKYNGQAPTLSHMV